MPSPELVPSPAPRPSRSSRKSPLPIWIALPTFGTWPTGTRYGTVRVGLHCGVAATEWHLHAWDLSHALEHRHQPQDPQALFIAAGTCLAEARGGLGGAVLRLLVPLGARSNPWSTILRRSGRSPAPAGMSERG